MPYAMPAKRVMPDGVLPMVNEFFQIGLHLHKFIFGHVGAFEHGFLDPGLIYVNMISNL